MKFFPIAFLSAVLCLSPLTASALDVSAAKGYAQGIMTYEKDINDISPNESLLSGKIADNAAEDSSDWLAIGAVRYGLENDTYSYYLSWKKNINDKYTHDGGLHRMKATEWHRAVLTCLCLGADPSDLSGIDLLEDGIFSRGDASPLDAQGLNGLVWGLIALDSCDWKVPDDAEVDRLGIIREIINSQNEDGGFSMESGAGRSDPDLTAMVLQSLAPYRECSEVRQVITAALGYLNDEKDDFSTCETYAQVICGLCCLGIDPDNDERFGGLTEELVSYANDDGGFAHEKDGESSEIASAQALIALCSIDRLRGGERSIYDMNIGAPAEMTAQSLVSAANAKEVNTKSPVTDGLPSPIKHESVRFKLLLIASLTSGITVAVVIGVILRRKRS